MVFNSSVLISGSDDSHEIRVHNSEDSKISKQFSVWKFQRFVIG